MVATINQAYISQFKDNIYVLLQQRGAKLRNVFPVENAPGEKHPFERLGTFTAAEITSRLEATSLQDPAHSRRTATVRRYAASTYLDDIDKFKMLIDPSNEYVIGLANAHGRNYDDVVLAALLGDAATGADGSGTQAFDSNMVIAHGSAGLTVAKLNQGMRLLEANEVDVERDGIVLIVNARGKEDLLSDSGVLVNVDYMKGKPLAGDKLMFRGVEIIWSERVPDIDASNFRAILCTKDSLKVAMSHDIKVETALRPDLNFAWQVSTYMMLGAVRMDEARVVDIRFQ